MLTKLFHILIAVILILASDFSRVLAQSAQTLVEMGDKSFNQGDYHTALDYYRRVYYQLEKTRPIAPLLTEVINNMGAVYIVQNNYNEFYRYFSAARNLKQAFVHQKVIRSKNNLLVNGDFEQGLIFPWGTGHYERPDGKFRFGVWWNSKKARAFMKIDTAIVHSGQRSLRITNYSPTAPHVFATLSQRISPLEPNTSYKISCFIKAEDLKPGAVGFTLDAAWTKRPRAIPGGTYDWQAYADTINIGHNNYIDFRILSLNTGTVWLDDMVVAPVETFDQGAQFQQAMRWFEQAEYGKALKILLKLERTHQDNRARIRDIDLFCGRTYMVLGQYRKALKKFNRVIQNGNARATIDLADLYYTLGDYAQAETDFKKSMRIVAGDQGTESVVLNKLSRCLLAQGKADQALKAQQKALFILRHIEDKHGQAQSLNQLGIIYQHKGMTAQSEAPLREALVLAETLGDRQLASDIRLNLAETARLQNKWDKADEYAITALTTKKAIGDQLGTVKVLHLQGRLQVARENLENGRKKYQRAIHRLETLIADTADISRETKAVFIKAFAQLYREYTELLLRLYEQSGEETYHHLAFQITEQARSRIFTEMITETRALQAFVSTSKDPELVKLLHEERLLNAKIHGLEQHTGSKRQVLDARERNRQLQQTRENRRMIRERLAAAYPRYAELKKPTPLTIEDVQALLQNDEAVMSYFVTPGRTGLWAITRRDVAFKVIPLSRDALIGRSEAFRRVFSEIPDLFARTDGLDKNRLQRAFTRYDTDEAYALYKMLISPAALLLKNKSTVYLAPDDLLYKLPFETLLSRPFKARPNGADAIIGKELRDAPFWVKTHTIAYLPSLSVLRSLRKLGEVHASTKDPLLAFADPAFEPGPKNPDWNGTHAATRSAHLARLQTRSAISGVRLPSLPDTRDEALSVARILGALPEKAIYLQERASEYNLKRLELTRFQYLLFATHGFMAGEFGPGVQPALALSFVNDPENDGLLEMGEILGLNLNADMVVLSACNTASGAGANDNGEGFAGLTRSFMYAGARSLLVTQWSVESSSAKLLVQNTFKKAPKRTIGDALALSKRAMIKYGATIRLAPQISVSTSHPFFWAPYILVGEGR